MKKNNFGIGIEQFLNNKGSGEVIRWKNNAGDRYGEGWGDGVKLGNGDGHGKYWGDGYGSGNGCGWCGKVSWDSGLGLGSGDGTGTIWGDGLNAMKNETE